MDAACRLALVGNPNCGKSALFNALTGRHQKVGNYPGVTVEHRAGMITAGDGAALELIDLPGTYSLDPDSPDEAVARDVILGGETANIPPDAVLVVVDATALRTQLRFAVEIKALGRPLIVALNMMDLAKRDGIEIDLERLSQELGAPVIPTVAVRKSGVRDLIDRLPKLVESVRTEAPSNAPEPDARHLQAEARRIAKAAILKEGVRHKLTRRADAVALHPVAGPAVLTALLFLMFQAVFSWAETPMNWIDASIVWLQQALGGAIPVPWLNSLLVDGILAGVGSVIIFLPQILILFLFILLLEQTGYMARAAFLMDRLMAPVGLNGRAFIPLLSSFACAIPGIMATRSIPDERDRLTTILIAPLMTCSARLPVYTLIIAAFIPNTTIWGFAGLQGLVMLALYLIGVLSALIVALVLKRTLTRGAGRSFMMVMPKYQIPPLRDLGLGLWQRAGIFLRRAGTIILASTVILWLLASFPAPPAGATEPDIVYSAAGTLGRLLAPLFAPVGFSWEMVIALIPGMAAREVAVAALGTVYAVGGGAEAGLASTLRSAWSLPTALSFLAWYIFAPQCLSTLAITKRETNSWRWPVFMFAYLFGLAYLCSALTYWGASALVG